MSWWDIENGNVMGDGPADLLSSTLSSIAEARENAGRRAPTLQEILDGFASALKIVQDKSLDKAQPTSFQNLVARLESAPAVTSGGEAGAADSQVVSAFQQAFAQIEEQYQERWERKPRLAELLEALSFILGYRPDRFLSDADELNISEITTD
jgi:hypothetical protein